MPFPLRLSKYIILIQDRSWNYIRLPMVVWYVEDEDSSSM